MKWTTRDELLKRCVSSLLSYVIKFADLRFADWKTKEICELAIFGCRFKIYGFTICGFKKKIASPPLQHQLNYFFVKMGSLGAL
jgi:hypothetical protein